MLARHANRILWAAAMAVGLLFFWLLLAGNDGWEIGLPAAVLAAGTGAWLAPGRLHRIRPLALIRFGWLFLVKSLAGGLDASWRALHPAMPLEPGWVAYPLVSCLPAARALFMITISLTPGTLCAELRGNTVRVHVLRPGVEDDLRAVERAIRAIFGEDGSGEQP